MKGKEALSAARKRLEDAQVMCASLEVALKSERDAHRQQIHDLESQLRRARADHMAEASIIAAEEVTRRLEEFEEERRNRGLSDDIVMHMIYSTDRFIMNACRYVSMTTGIIPTDALAIVLAWKTDKDVTKLPRVDQLIELGIPADGWVAREAKRLTPGWRRTALGRFKVVSLDHAVEQSHSRIHKDYRDEWYPTHVEYAGIELVDAES
ncbi:MAG: hypothetical protein NVSMB60_30250 [Mycobacterium sp.]